MHRMPKYYVSVRNHEDRQKPIIVFESDNYDEAREYYDTLFNSWFDRTHEDEEYTPDGEHYREWWQEAPRLVERTGEPDYPLHVERCAYSYLCC